MRDLFGEVASDEESDWLTVSDLMAGLMVIFLFIAIVFIRPLAMENTELSDKTLQLEIKSKELEKRAVELRKEKARMTSIAVAFQDREVRIYEALSDEFIDDLSRWNAEIDKETLQIRFKSPEVLFERGKATIREEFASILSDFFPRYASVLTEFRDSIEEIRIEGHTSSIWNRTTAPEEAYFENMKLSQERTRAVLQTVLSLEAVRDARVWLQPLLTANGLSSSRPVFNLLGAEDPGRSRRVEFRVRTTARSEIVNIIKAAQ